VHLARGVPPGGGGGEEWQCEKGERDGEKVKIPKHVRLACYALIVGVADYHGPEAELAGDGSKQKRKRKRAAEPEIEAPPP
jgi:hypothetical protein